MRASSLLLFSPLLAAASPTFSIGTVHAGAAPVISSVNSKPIDDNYIVVLKKDVDKDKFSSHQDWVKRIHTSSAETRVELRKRDQVPLVDSSFRGLRHTFEIPGHLRGYTGHFQGSVVEQIRRSPDVEFIEKDSIVHTMNKPLVERNAPWGLARISHRETLNIGNYNQYLFSGKGGEGVDVYVIDTGTNVDHVDFEGRARWGKTVVNNDQDIDNNGHGTHCSGIVAGHLYGVAKSANVYAVKVLHSNGSGSMSDVIKGVEYAAEQHVKNSREAQSGRRRGFKGSVANMSLGGGKSPALDMAVNAAVDLGLHFAVAAGNDDVDACNTSPASAEKAFTVGASTLQDQRADFSNHGPCVDIFAPGHEILSAWIGSNYAINTISGTSMASPHIAGLLAYILSLSPDSDSAFAVPNMSPMRVKEMVMSIGTQNALSGIPERTRNILAWNGGGASNISDIVASAPNRPETGSGAVQASDVTMLEMKDGNGMIMSQQGVLDLKIEKVAQSIAVLDERVQSLGRKFEKLVSAALSRTVNVRESIWRN